MNDKFSIDTIKKYVSSIKQKYEDEIKTLKAQLEEKQLAKALNDEVLHQNVEQKEEKNSLQDLDKIIGGIE